MEQINNYVECNSCIASFYNIDYVDKKDYLPGATSAIIRIYYSESPFLIIRNDEGEMAADIFVETYRKWLDFVNKANYIPAENKGGGIK